MSDSDLIAFLNTRLYEDEAAALAAAGTGGKYGGRPHWSADRNIVADADDPDWGVVDLSPCIDDASLGAHIARHDPSRVLREVEAKRAIVRRYERGTGGELPEWQAGRELITAGLAILLGVLRDLAVVYSDHPDYRQEWKP